MYKKMIIMVVIIFTGSAFFGCNDHSNNPENFRPVPPQGIMAIAQDKQVYLSWYPNYEYDVTGYNIYVSNSYEGKYAKIGFTSKTEFYDKGVSNGITYYYAITALDRDGYESDLSIENVFATPRPEIFSVALYDYKINPTRSGYTFGSNTIVPYNSTNTDIYFENANGVYYMVVFKDSDIQDMGYTAGFDEIAKSPTKGWSPTKDVQLIIGHTYVVWTYDNHYAKFRVADLFTDHVIIDCAFQLQKGSPYLKRNAAKQDRIVLNSPEK